MLRAASGLGIPVTIASVFAACFLAQATLAQVVRDSETDLLDQMRRMERVVAQKLEADVRQALRDAERLLRSDRAKALARLQQALAQVQDDLVLPRQRRESLEHMLKDRIRVTLSETDGTAPTATKTLKKATGSGQRAQEDGRAADKTRESLSAIRKLQSDGKTEAAQREASGLARQHPDEAAAAAAELTTRAADQIDKARRLQTDRERLLASGFRAIDKSATLPKGDVDFPSDWKDRTKGRTTTVPLTAKERSILQALNSTIAVNFRNSKLEDVIEYLQTYTGQAILLDREGMKDAEVSYETALTLNVKGVTVRTVLRKILADLGLTYVIKDETIQVTSAQRARDMTIVRRYYIGDLLAGMSALGNPAAPQGGYVNPVIVPGGIQYFGGVPFVLNPQLQALHNMENVKQLIDLIQSSVDPQSWQANGGSGTIAFHAPSMSLVIKQTAEVHAMLGSGGLLR